MKNFFFFILLTLPSFTNAELFLEITKGSDDPFKVAMIPFQGSSGLSKQINRIILNDLTRTGEFSMLDEKLLLPLKMVEEELKRWTNWTKSTPDYWDAIMSE